MPLRDSIKNKLDHKTKHDVEMFEHMIHDLIHHSGGGAGSLSARMGYPSAESLQNEVCLTNERFKFGALELFVALRKVPRSDMERFMVSLDSMLGRSEPCPGVVKSSSSLMAGLAVLGKEQNEVTAKFFESVESDGLLDDRERIDLMREIDDVIKAAALIKADLVSGVPIHGQGK